MAPVYFPAARTSGKELHQRNSCSITGLSPCATRSGGKLALMKSAGIASLKPPSVQITIAEGLIAFVSR